MHDLKNNTSKLFCFLYGSNLRKVALTESVAMAFILGIISENRLYF